jgi:hypothetical protein
MRTLGPVVFVCACLLVAAGCVPAAVPTPAPPTLAPPTPTPDLAAPAKAWADAMNKGDVDAALAVLADDVTWLGGHGMEEPQATGKETLREQLDFLVGLESKYQIKDCQPQDGGMVCALSEANGCIAAFGAADGLTGQLEFVYQPDGKVREASLTIVDPRARDYDRFGTAADGWALVNRAEEWAKLTSETPPKEDASTRAKLCREYAATKK